MKNKVLISIVTFVCIVLMLKQQVRKQTALGVRKSPDSLTTLHINIFPKIIIRFSNYE